jgi:hypothetical protein
MTKQNEEQQGEGIHFEGNTTVEGKGEDDRQ